MKPFHENDLIAYHLHELTPRRARALEQALRTDAALAAEFAAYATMLQSFKGVFPLDVEEETIERNWRQLWRRLPITPLKPVLFPRWRLAAVTGAALAFAAVIAFVATHPHTPQPSIATRDDKGIHPIPSPVPQGSPSPADTTPRLPSVASSAPHVFTDSSNASSLLPGNTMPPQPMAPFAKKEEQPPVMQFIPLAHAGSVVPSTPAPTRITPLPAGPEQDAAGRSSQPSGVNLHRNIARRDHPMDITLAMGGTLIGDRSFTNNGATHAQGAAHAVSAIASFHQQLRPAVGYRATFSYTDPDFHYDSSAGRTNINGRILEVAGTYVVQGPHRGIVRTTVEGGAGLMSISPNLKNTTTTTSKNLRAAAIVGVSAEFAVTKHLAIHTAYRVQIFKGPDFNATGSFVPILPTTLISNEPMVGITYRFSHQ